MPFDRARQWLAGTLSDETLAHRLQDGDLRALSALFERHHSSIYRFLLRMIGCPDEAEDLAQDTFLRAFVSIQAYAPDRPFRPWLYTIAQRVCWKRLSERRAEAAVSLDDLPEHGDLLDAGAEDPAEVLDRRVIADTIRRAVQGLPDDQRTVFVLYHYESIPYDQIAEICDCPIGTVKSRMHYALHHLRRRLAYLREDAR